MTKKLLLGNVEVGGGSPITIQSMNTTEAKDIKASIKQINDLTLLGCEIARLAINDEEDAKALPYIIKETSIPIVSDIQFDYRLALLAIENGTHALRINPGNIGGKNKTKEVVRALKEKGIPCRIGVNSGSIRKDLLSQGISRALVQSAIEEIEIFESLDYRDICISIKASDVRTMVQANREIAKLYDYPLHLGVTEAGTQYRGSIKSAMAFGILLDEGIGDTIRVSLTEDPIMEVKAAKEILINLGLRGGLKIVSCPTCGRTKINLIALTKEVEEVLKNVDRDITVAVMGCAVNGPGEAREADYGIAGGVGEGLIFKKGEIIKKVPEERLLDELLEMIMEDKIEGINR